MSVTRAQCPSVLAPHAHLHISHDRLLRRAHDHSTTPVMNPGTASPTRATAQARPAAASGARIAAPGEARIQLEHPGFGGDSILPRCSGLGGRCLPRYRRLAEPRSDHFSAFVLSNICPAGPGLVAGSGPPGRPPEA